MGLLREIFGPSKAEIWQQLANQAEGHYVDGGFFRGDKVVLTHDRWTITLDTFTVNHGKSSTTYTRMRAPYVNRDGFRFEIYPERFFSGIGKALGGQDIQIHDAFFDNRFIIKGNSEAKVREFLSNPQLQSLIKAQPRIRFQVKDDEGWFGTHFPEGVDELCFTCAGVIKDIDQLQSLYELFAVALDQLCHIGSAYEDNPHVDL